jgi:hypothetical protein
MSLAYATSVASTVPRLYRGNVALQPFNLTKERLSRHRGLHVHLF